MTDQPASPATGGGVEREMLDDLDGLIAKKQASIQHVEENRDGWFATMPEDLIDADKAEAELLSRVRAALSRNEGAAEGVGREEIARIIDPIAHEMQGRVTSSHAVNQSYEHQWSIALRKADDILSRLPTPAAEGDRVLVPCDDHTRPVSDSKLPEAMIWAGVKALDQVHEDQANYTPGVTTDWDDGMVAVAVFRAMCAAAPASPADGGGGEGVLLLRAMAAEKRKLAMDAEEQADGWGACFSVEDRQKWITEAAALERAADEIAALASRPAVEEKLVEVPLARAEQLASLMARGQCTTPASVGRELQRNLADTRAALKAHGGEE